MIALGRWSVCSGCALLVAHGAGSAVGAATTTGVSAIVTRGPVMPVCREGTPCDEPAAAVAFVIRAKGRVVARPVTNAQGRFSVRLAPGSYVVSLARLPAIGVTAPRRFAVRAGAVTTLRLDLDTGIR